MLNFSRLKKDKKEANMGSIFLKQFIGFYPQHMSWFYFPCVLCITKNIFLYCWFCLRWSLLVKKEMTQKSYQSPALLKENLHRILPNLLQSRRWSKMFNRLLFLILHSRTLRGCSKIESQGIKFMSTDFQTKQNLVTCDMILFIIIIIIKKTSSYS